MQDTYSCVEQLPLALSVEDVANVLGIGRRQAYRLCHSKGFPCLNVGRRLIIPKPAFVKWMENPQKMEG
jgi:excisionase family DNA binding protein